MQCRRCVPSKSAFKGFFALADDLDLPRTSRQNGAISRHKNVVCSRDFLKYFAHAHSRTICLKEHGAAKQETEDAVLLQATLCRLSHRRLRTTGGRCHSG